MRMTSVLEIKVWCSVMPPQNGIPKPSIHILTTWPTSSVRNWLPRDTPRLSPGWDLIASLKSSLNMKGPVPSLNQFESTTSWSPLNTITESQMKKLKTPSLKKLSRKSAPLKCSKTPKLLSTPLDHSKWEVHRLMLDSLEEKSLSTPMEDGPHTVEVPSLEKTPLKLIDQQLTMQDM